MSVGKALNNQDRRSSNRSSSNNKTITTPIASLWENLRVSTKTAGMEKEGGGVAQEVVGRGAGTPEEAAVAAEIAAGATGKPRNGF